uniref:Expression site-associated gene 2 (ESAG2) protein n=1 Tax=Trypanosoma brucei brucei TaxID=5702 RepID=B3GVH7_TRYBB|nr:expression site-associated gene 2 (ESAG2) protein [Trypanosoma brucei brucei]CAQ57355.1 expression site-associated gene 2 (ESAG2) protein [Trypanosoma brucei brucei]
MRYEIVFVVGLFAAVLCSSSEEAVDDECTRDARVTNGTPDWDTITECVSGDYMYHNTGDFDVLCKIYRITQAELPQPSFKNREKEGEIMSKLEEMVREVEAAGGTQDLNHSSNRTTAYQEIKKLFEKAKKLKEEIEVNRTKALNASRSAKDNMLRAVYGEAVDVARNENKTLEKAMRGNKALLFNSVDHANMSCGSYGDKLVGKTLINDFFCLCVGEAINVTGEIIKEEKKKEEKKKEEKEKEEKEKEEGVLKIGPNATDGDYNLTMIEIYNRLNCPCKDAIRRPKSGSWTMMAEYCDGDGRLCDPENVTYGHTEAWDVISEACVYKNIGSNVKTLKSALAQFDDLVNLEQDKYQVKGILGYVRTDHNKNHACTGHTAGFTCVSYKHTLENGGIPWYNRLSNATVQLQEMDMYAKEADSHLHELEEYEDEAEEIFLEVKLGGDAELWKSSQGKGYSGGDDTVVNNDGLTHLNIATGVAMLLIISLICTL